MAKLQKIILIFALFLLTPFFVDAANLSFSPVSGTHTIGETFSMHVVVGSSDQAMNAASGIVSFPWDKLAVVSVSKAGSIFSLWPAEPSFSNTLGTVNFEGIVLNPGYTGSSGTILTITFRAKTEGQANISFSSGSVLANDGSGTNILNGLQVSTLTLITPKGEVKPDVPTSVSSVNANGLFITSLTHPDSSKWYVNNTPEFSWVLPAGALETRIYMSKSETSTPIVSYIPAISKKKVDELSDGTYYFSVQVRTNTGWSAVSRYKINIDSTPPKPFSIKFPHGNSTFEPQPVVYFNTTDDESGISHYDIHIGATGKPDRVSPVAMSNPYVLPPQTPGTYELAVIAIDSAGNTRSDTTEFTVEGIDSPEVTYYPETMELGDIFTVRGTTYANSDVYITIYENNAKIFEDFSRSNSLGDFSSVITKRLEIGSYTFTVRVVDGRGAQSKETELLPILVQGSFLTSLITSILKYLSATILIILVFGGIIGFIIFIGFRIKKLRKKMCKKTEEAVVMSAEAFHVLHKDIQNHIEQFEKAKLIRNLSEEESAFLRDFDKSLEKVENTLLNKIKEISNK